MKKFVKIHFADASYEVPVMAIAMHRAESRSAGGVETLETALEETEALFEHNAEIVEYIKYNMMWSDLRQYAAMVAANPANRNVTEAITEFGADLYDDASPIGELPKDADEIKVGHIASHAQLTGEQVSALFIGSPPEMAIYLMVGTPQEVNGFTNGVRALSEMIQQFKPDASPEAAPEPSRLILPH